MVRITLIQNQGIPIFVLVVLHRDLLFIHIMVDFKTEDFIYLDIDCTCSNLFTFPRH